MSEAHKSKEWDRLAASVIAQARVDDAPCIRCGQPIDYNAAPNAKNGPTADHEAPIGLGNPLLTDQVGPAHRSCNSSHGAKLGNMLRATRQAGATGPAAAPAEVVARGDDGGPLVAVGGELPEQFNVPWIEPLLPVPVDGTWPRLSSAPHPRAVGSLGWEIIERMEKRRESDPMVPAKQKRLRWWQKLLIVRMYEVDQNMELVWLNVVVSTSRQVGKSVALREIALDRITRADWYGEAQLVLHVAKDLTIADEIQRPARQWAGIMEDHGQPWHPIGNNGRWAVEYQGVMGRWLIRAQNAVYGFSASTALVDEGWAIEVGPISEGIEPTMAEREQPHLLLVSTAHSKATELMPTWRRKALVQIDHGDDTLILEWSAPKEASADRGNIAYHRMASPHWNEHRRKFIGSRVNEDGFLEQWLNIWPAGAGVDETMTNRETWDSLVAEFKMPTSGSSGRTLSLYPDVTQSSWHLSEAALDAEQMAYLNHVGTYPSMKQALEAVGRAVASGAVDLIIPRFVRGRVPKMPGVRALIQASESDIAAASTTVKPMIADGRLRHNGADTLTIQMPRAVVDRYGDTVRISTKLSPGPVEAAKGAVLAVWWASRQDRPRAVVV